jgi:hypothetical protein
MWNTPSRTIMTVSRSQPVTITSTDSKNWTNSLPG